MKLFKRLLMGIFMIGFLALTTLFTMGYLQYKEAIDEVSIVEKIAEIKQNSSYVDHDDIASDLLQATVAIEDRRFYSHNGIDYFATARAIFSNIIQKDMSGGSTITQQLAKNLYFGYEPSIVRKISEMFVAHDLEGMYSKEEILTFYVNIINYGDNHMGIREASMGYFQVQPDQLDLDQASLLAGLPQSPSNFQLSNHEPSARLRQVQVLKAMVKEELISEKQKNIIQENAGTGDT